MKIKPIFRWFDLWIGLFIDVKSKTIYFFPIPMFGLKITYGKRCPYCGRPAGGSGLCYICKIAAKHMIRKIK